MVYQTIEVDESVGPVGARISGVDLSKPLPLEVQQEIRVALLAHYVLFFSGQNLDPAQQARFSEYFGELDAYPFVKPLDAHANVIPVIKEPEDEFNFGGAWHTDTSYLERPPRLSILYAVEVPEEGGDTLFADSTSAYADLSGGMKHTLEALDGIYSPKQVHKADGSFSEVASREQLGESYRSDTKLADLEVEHPLIRTHVESGRKSIYCSELHTDRIKGWTRQESIPIFRYLTDHLTQEKYVTRFKWANGSVAMWDNCSVFHNPLNDYPGVRRHMHRVIVKGERPH